MKDHSS